MSRIFLSHSSKDNVAAVALADWLKDEGWDDAFLDLDPVQGIHPGERWERALYTHAADCEAVLFLVSKNWLGSEWCRREYDLARKLNKRCFVILIERIEIDDLPLFLKETHQTVSLGTGEDHRVFRPKMPISHEEGYVTFSAEGLRRLKIGLEQAGLDPRFFAWPPANEPNRAPYRGLEPLDQIDAGVFFGRDGPIIEALDVLRGLHEATPPRLFVILGASGAGKSSFLRAGLLPRLSRDDRNFMVLPVVRPDREAISGPAGFIASIAEAAVQRGLQTTRAQVRQATAEGSAALRPILKRLVSAPDSDKPPTIVLTIDQAEELFRTEAAEEGEALLELVHDLAEFDDPALLVIFAIRSDSYDALERAKALQTQKQHTFALLPMPHGAYQTIIEGPLKRLRQAGRKFEIDPGLTEALLEDIEKGGGSDALPLLSFTLELLYRDHEAARHISREDYRDFGGLKGAIDAALKRAFAFADLDPRVPKDYEARLALLRRGFIPWLAGVDPETKSLRRRVARASQIPEEARPLIDILVAQRLLTRDVDKDTGEATIEPAHEALLRQWGGLKGWLEEDFGRLAALESVKRAAMDWDANARAAAWAAHGGARLADADQLDLRPDLSALLNATDRAYLSACRQKEKQARDAEDAQRRTEADLAREKNEKLALRERASRRIMQVSVAGGLFATAFAMVAGWQWKNADEARSIAEKQLAAATGTANTLVLNVVRNIRDVSGIPSSVLMEILTIAHELQENLLASGLKNHELQRSHAVAREETVSTCLAIGNTSCAKEAAQEAVELRKAVSDSDAKNPELRMDLAGALSRMGAVKRSLGDLPEALDYFNQALSIRSDVVSTHLDRLDWRSALSLSHDNVGDVEMARGRPAAAFEFYRKALQQKEGIVAADPKTSKWRGSLAQSFAKVGASLFEQHDLVGAAKSYRDGRDIIKALSKEDPKNTRWRQDLAMMLERIGDVHFAFDELGSALGSFRESAALREALVASDPGKARWRRDLAASYNKIGDAQLADSDFEGAANSYGQAIAIIRVLVASDEQNADWQRDLSKSLSRIGDVRLAQGDLGGALTSYRDSLAIMEALPPADSSNSRWREDIANLNEYIGTILYNKNDVEGATDAFRRALSAYEEIAKGAPGDIQMQLRIVETHKKLAKIDKAQMVRHIEAAAAILEKLSESSRLDEFQRRLIDYGKTQLSSGRIDLYNLVGRLSRLAKK